jgi:hypothetical protein
MNPTANRAVQVAAKPTKMIAPNPFSAIDATFAAAQLKATHSKPPEPMTQYQSLIAATTLWTIERGLFGFIDQS